MTTAPTLALEGAFCVPPEEAVRPTRVLLAIDAAASMRVADPAGSRAEAIADLMDQLPQDEAVSFAVMLFQGNTVAWLTHDGTARFEPVTRSTAADRQALVQRVLTFSGEGDETDFVRPLDEVYRLLNEDLSETRLARDGRSRAHYTVIFLSDGAPTQNQDEALLCGDAVARIRALRELADDVTLNTALLFRPTQPPDSSGCDPTTVVATAACGLPDLPVGTCAAQVVDQRAERLRRMAERGGGTFLDFRAPGTVSFARLPYGLVRPHFEVDRVVVSNRNVAADGALDTDADGLLDRDEPEAGTSPLVVDSDGDGFSDGVEVRLRARGAGFQPNSITQPDLGCPRELRGVDSDCDGLTDCDELVLGSNLQRVDSDEDGVADSVEFQFGTQLASDDVSMDPDVDGVDTGVEVERHTDPFTAGAPAPETGYQYTVVPAGTGGDGQQCFSIQVSNIGLGPASAGELLLSVSMRATDAPTTRPFMRTLRRTATKERSLTRFTSSDLEAVCQP